MKISARSFRFVSSSLLAAATVVAALGASAGSANAAKPRPTPTVVPAPTTAAVLVNRPDLVIIQVAAAVSSSQDFQLISGPNSAGRPVVAGIGGALSFENLVANSDYVYQVRNVRTRLPFVVSAWAQFSFHTATNFATRPNPPQNLRVTQTTATSVTVMWDADTTPRVYKYSLNGGTPISTDSGCFPYCTGEELLSATFARPAPGTSVLFSVTGRDNDFNTSLPATLVVTN